MNRSKVKRIIALLLCALVLVINGSAGLAAPTPTLTDGVTERRADGSTMETYNNALKLKESSRYAGRVWSDKTVFAAGVSASAGAEGTYFDGGALHLNKTNDGTNGTVAGSSDFLHVFSVLGSSQHTDGLYQVPLDVVFILDTSASMSDTDPNNGGQPNNQRLKKAAESLNYAMQTLMSTGSLYNRVGLVEFNSLSYEVMSLGRYEPDENGDYFTYELENNRDPSSRATKINITAKATPNEGGKITKDENTLKPRVPTSRSIIGFSPDHEFGMTNTQAGIYTGMNMLAGASETDFWLDADGVKHPEKRDDAQQVRRIPIVILLSDGQPTFSLADPNWWAPRVWFGERYLIGGNQIPDNGVQGSYFDASYFGNGMLPLLTATYMKRAINRHYYNNKDNGQDDVYKAQVYTMGLDLPPNATSDTNQHIRQDEDLALATLNPGKALQNESSDTWDIATDINAAWRDYCAGKEPSIRLKATRLYPPLKGFFGFIAELIQANPLMSITDNGPHYNPVGYSIAGNDPDAYKVTHIKGDDLAGTGVAAEDLNYVDDFFRVRSDDEDTEDSKDLNEAFQDLIERLMADAPFIPISGSNDALDANALTYIDPIGKYMEVKTVSHLLLFGRLWELSANENIEYYKATDAEGAPTGNEKDYAYSLQYYTFGTEGMELANPCYGYSDPNEESLATANVTFPVSDIKIYIKTTNNFRDPTLTGSAIQTDPGEDQLLYVVIPAKALPVQVANIDMKRKAGTNTTYAEYSTNLADEKQSTPLRVFYQVGMDNGVLTNNEIDLAKISASYLDANRKNGSVYFYSNWYNEKFYDGYITGPEAKSYTYGDPVLTFSPNRENRFYIFQRPLELYKATETPSADMLREGAEVKGSHTAGWSGGGLSLREPVSDVQDLSSTEYYYMVVDYYKADGTRAYRAIPRLGGEFGSGIGGEGQGAEYGDYLCWYDPENGGISPFTKDPDTEHGKPREGGPWYVATNPGGLRVGDMAQSVQEKGTLNATDTAGTYYLPTISASSHAEDIVINTYLGNNGLLYIADTELLVTKVVLNDQATKEADFEYTIELPDYAGKTLNAIVVTLVNDEDKKFDTWRAKIETIELLTSNRGLLVGNDGKIARMRWEEGTGQYVADPEGPYYMYVGGESGNFAKTIFSAKAGDVLLPDKDATTRIIPVEAYPVPVADYTRIMGDPENYPNGWTFAASGLTEADKIAFPAADVDIERPIGYEVKSDYELNTTRQTVAVPIGSDGKGSFTLKHGQGLLFTGLEPGAVYTVTETLTDDQVAAGVALDHVTWEDWIWNGKAAERIDHFYPGDAKEAGSENPIFDEERHSYGITGETEISHVAHLHYYNGAGGKLQIEKTVRDATKHQEWLDAEFTFKVTLRLMLYDGSEPDPMSAEYPYTIEVIKDSGGKQPAESEKDGILYIDWEPSDSEDYVYEGSATVTLRHGQRIIISGLPYGAFYIVEEQPSEGFQQVFRKDDTGWIEPPKGGGELPSTGGGAKPAPEEEIPTAQFENAAKISLPQVGGIGTLPFYGLGALLLALAAAGLFALKKKRI